MLEWIGLEPQQWTLSGIVGLIVLMVLFGWLLPRWTVKDIIRDRDAWKTQALSLKDTARLLAEAAKENAEPAKTVAKVITAAQDRMGVADETVE